MSASSSAASSPSVASAAGAAATTASRKRTHALVQSTIAMHAKPKATAEATAADADAAAESAPVAAAADSTGKRSRRAASPSATAAVSSSAATAADASFWTYCPSVIPGVAASSDCAARSASAECDRFYTELRALVSPTPGRIFVYGKHHEERRLTGVYARAAGEFSYSGKTTATSGAWPAVLEQLHEIAVREASRVQRDKDLRQRQRVQGGGNAEEAEHMEEESNKPSAASAAAPAAVAAASAPPSSSSSVPFHWDTVLINFYRDGGDSISWHSDKDCADSTIASFSFGAQRDFQVRQRPAKGSGGSTKHLRSWSLSLANGSLLLMHPGMQSRFHHALPARKSVLHGRINVTFRNHNRVPPAAAATTTSTETDGVGEAAAASTAAASSAPAAPKHVRG